jgi:hypothetical protein
MALALLMSSSVSGVLMIGLFALDALEAVVGLVLVLVAAVILGFLVGWEVSLSESAVGEELVKVAEEEEGEWGCLRFLGTVGFLLVPGTAWKMSELDQWRVTKSRLTSVLASSVTQFLLDVLEAGASRLTILVTGFSSQFVPVDLFF